MKQLGANINATVREVAGNLGIEVRPDREPERNLFRRADHYSFSRIGVPAVGFVFLVTTPGRPKSRSTVVGTRTCTTKDDIDQPIDFAAAAKFNLSLKSSQRRS
jgi:hypothetical protein